MTNAFQTLELLLQHNQQRLVAFDDRNQFYQVDFQQHVAQAIKNLNTDPYQKYLLYADNSYHFAVNFIALVLLQKDIILTANNKPDWLAAIQDSYQAIISDGSIEQLSAENSDQILAHLEVTHYQNTSEPQSQLSFPEQYRSNIQFYTSGSSSEPKAINKNIKQLLLEADNLEQLFGQTLQQSKFFATVSHHHIYGLIFRLLWPLLYKHPFSHQILLYPEELIAASQRHDNICLVSSPAFLSRHDNNLASVTLTQCFSSGSLLTAQAARLSYKQLKLFPVEVFGSTETGGIGYRTQANNNTAWAKFPGVVLTTNEVGRTTLDSPYIPHTEILDDQIRQVDDHQFELLGRIDRVVKIEEKRVSLDALEKAIQQSELVAEVKVVVLQHKRTFIGAVIALSALGQDFLEQHTKLALNTKLKNQLSQQFESVAIPRKWRYFEHLPYNLQGKLPIDTLMSLF
ncbi:hypothetical protein DZA50_02915 [Kangiella sp. HD9-110m-PIT-SAG07]|nr:hypothetical protein DZA50_02915 [Kangiella sp. HD9-110m-PIT-SAG07]